MLTKKICFIAIFCTVLNVVNSIRILCYYPVPFHSHQSVFQMLTAELARHGHELVVLTPLPHEQPIENVTEIDVHDVSYRLWEEGFAEFMKDYKSITVHPVDLWTDIVTPIFDKIVEAQLANHEIQAIIREPSQQFDVILAEAVIPLSIILSARFKAPVILVSSFYGTEENFNTIGAQIHPLLLPEFNLEKTISLSFLDKLVQCYTNYRLRLHEQQSKERQNKMIRKHFGVNAPTITELRKNVHMLFLNVHHIWDNNRPVPPSVVYMGALHVKKPKPIPTELQSYFNASRNGVIYMSLGSKLQLSDLPSQTIKKILDVVETLPYDVLMKWNGKELPNKPANLRLEKWLPQNDILHHPKIKAFITQGGLQSTDEAIAAKVPLIGLPVFGDQFYNVQKYIQHGIGAHLDINNLDKTIFRQTIIAVAEETSYRESIERLSRIMSEQRAGGLERAVYWTEYVGTHGALHLRSPLADASIIEYYMLDIVAAIVVALAIIVTILVKILKYFRTFLRAHFKLKMN